MAITKIDAATVLFAGQSDIVIFNEVDDYSDATFTSITENGQSLGQIVEDSTSWDGEAPTVDTINDEKGNIIVANTTAGTLAFSCDVASTSENVITTFLKGSAVSGTITSESIKSVNNLLKFGTALPVITRPIAIFNDEANRFILFPKAKIVGSLALDSKLWRVHLTVTAETIDTATLGTGMLGNGVEKTA